MGRVRRHTMVGGGAPTVCFVTCVRGPPVSYVDLTALDAAFHPQPVSGCEGATRPGHLCVFISPHSYTHRNHVCTVAV